MRFSCAIAVLFALLSGFAGAADLPPVLDRKIDFAQDVRPIFVKHCYGCHGPDKQTSGYRLDRKAAALKGGEIGVAIVPGMSAESPLIKYVAGLNPDMIMPPKGARLSALQSGILRAWIDQGAIWPETGETKEAVWWSLTPLLKPELPKLNAADGKWVRNPIDAFVMAKLREKNLSPSPEANPRTLIRRLSFDLIGLPPTPDEVDTFLSEFAVKPQVAYEALVDRLLASPHYGERWARHWLDVVHYGDTHGYDKDKPRPNAWPYRDYVIRAFNDDRPYARFVQEQIAGDVLFPGTVDGIEALGFISAGPWDFIGHAEVPETKIDGKIARHLDRDDMVTNTMMTFASTTVQCAQCHNHKFDPILQEDYYSLQAVFAALDRADRSYYRNPVVAKRAAELQANKKHLLAKKKELDARIAKAHPELAALNKQIESLKSRPAQGERPEFGYHSGIAAKQDVAKWVQIDLDKPVAIASIEYVGCHDNFNDIGAGFGFPVRFKIEVSDEATFTKSIVVLDRTGDDVLNPGVTPQRANVAKSARYVRITATKLAPRQNDFIFALAELSVLNGDGVNLAAGAQVTALDSIEAPPRWRKSNLVDGYWYGKKSGSNDSILAVLQRNRTELMEKIAPATRDEMTKTDAELAAHERELATLPAPSVVYSGTIHSGGGTFAGTGATGGKPRPIHLLKRGSVTEPLKEVSAGTISSIQGLPSRFELPPDHKEGERRAALAKWLSDAKNPLTWRSIANRIWRYHIGRGIVESPNDFGKMGQLPTHPDLLDWLAFTFREEGGSIKKLHKLIVTSATYRQSSQTNEAFAKLDADNAYLWRMNRRRLEAEAIRDSALFVSGKLDAKLYGPAFQDFVIEKPEHSPHYEYHLHDPEDPKTHRRSIYRFLVRSQTQPFMTTLDCADPSLQVDKRNETLSALQALAMLNNGFMLAMAKHMAVRVEKIEGDETTRITAAMRLAVARAPSNEELKMLMEYARKHGMANACRVILNLNEFVFVD